MFWRLRYWWLFMRLWTWRPPVGVGWMFSVSPGVPLLRVYLGLIDPADDQLICLEFRPGDPVRDALGVMDAKALTLLPGESVNGAGIAVREVSQ